MSLTYSKCEVAVELQRERLCKYVLYSTAEMYFIPNATLYIHLSLMQIAAELHSMTDAVWLKPVVIDSSLNIGFNGLTVGVTEF